MLLHFNRDVKSVLICSSLAVGFTWTSSTLETAPSMMSRTVPIQQILQPALLSTLGLACHVQCGCVRRLEFFKMLLSGFVLFKLEEPLFRLSPVSTFLRLNKLGPFEFSRNSGKSTVQSLALSHKFKRKKTQWRLGDLAPGKTQLQILWLGY